MIKIDITEGMLQKVVANIPKEDIENLAVDTAKDYLNSEELKEAVYETLQEDYSYDIANAIVDSVSDVIIKAIKQSLGGDK